MKDALTDDIFLISYSYNFGIPRFYTKGYAKNQSRALDYDVKMDFAASASSATPFIFDPVIRYTFNNKKRDEELLIDGSVIANNPALYATVYAKNDRGKDNVRVVSIGFRPTPEKVSKNFTYMTALDWVQRLDEIILDAKVSSHNTLASLIAEDFHRFDCVTKVEPYDSTSKS